MERLSDQGRQALATQPASSVTTPEEWQLRVNLAACYRLCALHGWDDGIYTHISAAIPGQPGLYLINPFGLHFSEVKASNLVKINAAGAVVGVSGHTVNKAGFALHAAVHAARPDVECVMHLHNVDGIAVGAQSLGLLPLSAHALRFYQQLGYHHYEGLAMTPQEQARLVERLGQHPAMLMRNHGTLVCGRTVAEAYVLMETLDKACAIQLKAQTGGTSLHMPSPDTCMKAHQQLIGDGAPEGALEWPALLRKLDRINPDYRT